MLSIKIQSDHRRAIEQVTARGHINGSVGSNIGCAAASALFRTFIGILEQVDSIQVFTEAPEPGTLDMRIESVDHQVLAWYIGACDFLIRGLQDTVSDYPEQVSLRINKDTKE